MITAWNALEDEALQGLAWLDQLLYLRGLRRFMDYSTGIVGVSRGISYQMLGETMFVEPVPGRHSNGTGSPSQKAVRNALEELEKAGLIERRSSDKRLIFFLPMADRDVSVKKRRGRGGAEEGQTSGAVGGADQKQVVERAAEDGGADGAADRNIPKPPRRGTPPDTGINVKVKVNNTVASATVFPPELTDVEQVFQHWQQVMDHPGAKLDAKRKRAIQARLKDGYLVEHLTQAIDGCRSSEWYMGKNDRQQRYDDIELICRDAGKVDSFMALAHGRGSRTDLDAWIDEGGYCIEGEYNYG